MTYCLFYIFWFETKFNQERSCRHKCSEWVKAAVCGMRSVNLNDGSMKILGIHFSWNEKLKEVKNFYDFITNL